jgi:hypothetical protein
MHKKINLAKNFVQIFILSNKSFGATMAASLPGTVRNRPFKKPGQPKIFMKRDDSHSPNQASPV